MPHQVWKDAQENRGGRWGFRHFVLRSQEDVPLTYDADMPVSDETDIRGRGRAITKRRREATVEHTDNDCD